MRTRRQEVEPHAPSSRSPISPRVKVAQRHRSEGGEALESGGQKSEKRVTTGRQEHARTAGFAPHALVGRTGLTAVVVSGIELLVVDPQLAIEQGQLLD